jgi:hypothetical protein
MINWIKNQLTEPTAWLCFIIAIVALFTKSDFYVFWLCVIGIALDETWLKAKCNQYAPGISTKIDEWVAAFRS